MDSADSRKPSAAARAFKILPDSSQALPHSSWAVIRQIQCRKNFVVTFGSRTCLKCSIAWSYCRRIEFHISSGNVGNDLRLSGRKLCPRLTHPFANSAHIGSRAVLLDLNGLPARGASQGSFTLAQPTIFPHLAPGEYTLSVTDQNTTRTYRVTISEGQNTVLRVE